MCSTEPIIDAMVPGDAEGLSLAQDLGLLRLEPSLGQPALGSELRQPFELCRRGRCRRGRWRRALPTRRALVHPLLVGLALLVDDFLNALRIPDVVEAVATELRRRGDDQGPGADDPVQDPLL